MTDPADFEYHAPVPALRVRAMEVQDRLGWADPADHQVVTYATVDLARLVVELAAEVEALRAQVAVSAPARLSSPDSSA